MPRRTRLSKKMKPKKITRLGKVRRVAEVIGSPENVAKATAGTGFGAVGLGFALTPVVPFAGGMSMLIGLFPSVFGAMEMATIRARKEEFANREIHINKKIKEYLHAQERKAEKARKTRKKKTKA